MKENLKIYSYKDSARQTKLGMFECWVSPSTFKTQRNNLYGDLHPINSSMPISAFRSGGQSSVEVSFVLDGTGAYASKKDEPISLVTQLTDLMKNTVLYNGAIHQPPFLKLVWGSLPLFICRAETLDVDYKSFNTNGVPVQADIKLILVEDVDAELSKRQANKQSPDLFHEHLVGEKETLALISYNYYNDTRHLHLIARTNGLNSLYDCVPGTTLLIPPLHTTSANE